jgi:predicted permease
VDATTEPPASGNNMTFGFVIEGRPAANARGREDPQQLRVVTPGYFKTMGQPVLSGRAFDVTDRATTTLVVIVNQALARKHWPNDNPVGKRISLVGHDGPWLQIIGVAGDTRIENADVPPPPALYIPYAQRRPMWSWMSWASLMVRVQPGVEPISLLPAVRAALWELDPRLPIHGAMAVEDAYGQSMARRRFATTLLGAFAAVALVLGVVGMYGVLSYSVAQRRREMAIRLALGAGATQVVRVVVWQAVTLALIGVLLGGVAALALTRQLGSLLYEVSPTDPVTFVVVALLLPLVAALAAWIPARRALRIDPMLVMREA